MQYNTITDKIILDQIRTAKPTNIIFSNLGINLITLVGERILSLLKTLGDYSTVKFNGIKTEEFDEKIFNSNKSYESKGFNFQIMLI